MVTRRHSLFSATTFSFVGKEFCCNLMKRIRNKVVQGNMGALPYIVKGENYYPVYATILWNQNLFVNNIPLVSQAFLLTSQILTKSRFPFRSKWNRVPSFVSSPFSFISILFIIRYPCSDKNNRVEFLTNMFPFSIYFHPSERGRLVSPFPRD